MTSVAAVLMPLDQLVEMVDGGTQVRAMPFIYQQSPDLDEPVDIDEGFWFDIDNEFAGDNQFDLVPVPEFSAQDRER